LATASKASGSRFITRPTSKYLTRAGDKPLDATYTVTAAGKEWFIR
jgi:hypothetical protein